MYRQFQKELESWRVDPNRMPLLVRGARQVGKTYVLKAFGRLHFEETAYINFEKDKKYLDCFSDLDVQKILSRLQFIGQYQLKPKNSLLILDEIQACPEAIMALRYFKEDYPDLHVVAAGSLLEFTVNQEQFSMPVGRVQSMYLKPLSFWEYLNASGNERLIEHLSNVSVLTGIDVPIHTHLEQLVKEYFLLGGMPAIVSDYLEKHDFSSMHHRQTGLMGAYYEDFGKYAAKGKHQIMQTILEKVPGIIGECFKYSKIDSDVLGRDVKIALNDLVRAGLVNKVRHTSASGLPLNALVNDKKFKLLFLDIGLVNAMSFIDPALLFDKQDLMLINRGMLAEQFVGQELLAYYPPYFPGELYYWEREKKSSMAEVDYVINVNEQVVPIEVKSGKTGSLKSLQIFLKEKNLPFGIRLSSKPLSFKDNVLSVPLYMIHELRRLVLETATPKK